MSVPYGPAYWDEEDNIGPNNVGYGSYQDAVLQKPAYSFHDDAGVDGAVKYSAERFLSDNFATSLFLITFTLFATPMRLTMGVCSDIQVGYWITPDIPIYTAILPIVYLVVFFWHTCTRKPSKFLTIISLVGSCIYFLLVCDLVLVNSIYLGEAFSFPDCDAYPGKRMTQIEWESARSFYASCAAAKAKNSSLEFAAVVSIDRIQDCPGYEDQLKIHPAWSYLGEMEEQLGCSGWCQREHAIWTKREDLKDSCSVVSSQVFIEVIQTTMKQVVLYTVGVLLVVAFLFFMAGPVLRSQGIDW